MKRYLPSFAALLVLAATVTLRAQVYQPETCKNSFTRDQEAAEGAKVVAEVYKTMPVLPDTDPVSIYVQNIGDRLVAAAPMTPGAEVQWPFRFHVVASAEINAFALPGGTMFVNLGAIQAAETEAQLAGVMGHEMSHVILRHSTCNITKQRHKSILYSLGSIGSAILLGDSAAGSLAQTGIGAAQGLDFLHMSRTDEQQADLLGVQISHNAGYDPRGLPQFFEIIQAKTGSGGAQFLSDHPNPGNRTQYVNAEIAQLEPLTRPTINTPAFRSVRTQAATMKVYDAKQVQAGVWRSTGMYASAPGAAPARSSTPVSAQQAPQQGASTAPPIQQVTPLTPAQVGVADPLQRYQGPQWSLLVPKRWIGAAGQNGDATIAPPGGAGVFGVAYGVYAGVVKQPGNGITDAATLAAATHTFTLQLTQSNALTASGSLTPTQIAGQFAASMDLSGPSPVTANGRPVAEHDWLITVARTDGDMDFFLFVCPETDFASLRTLFVRMRDSIRP